MDSHSNGTETAPELEARLKDYGVTYPNWDGNGFVVVGECRVFVVDEPKLGSVENFCFREIPREHIQKFRVEMEYPDNRMDHNEDAERVERDTRKPCSRIRLWTQTDAVDCFVDADPREVASSIVTFTEEV
jgi:hypothetical protein